MFSIDFLPWYENLLHGYQGFKLRLWSRFSCTYWYCGQMCPMWPQLQSPTIEKPWCCGQSHGYGPFLKPWLWVLLDIHLHCCPSYLYPVSLPISLFQSKSIYFSSMMKQNAWTWYDKLWVLNFLYILNDYCTIPCSVHLSMIILYKLKLSWYHCIVICQQNMST